MERKDNYETWRRDWRARFLTLDREALLRDPLLLVLPRLLLGLGLLLLQKTVDGLLWGDHSLLFCTRR